MQVAPYNDLETYRLSDLVSKRIQCDRLESGDQQTQNTGQFNYYPAELE
jgi:hypothetical protein